MVLQIVLVIILERLELIDIIIGLLKKLSTMLWYSLSQLLIKMKINITMLYF